jgi:hypothetical protein
MTKSRREFLLGLATGAIYAAPLVRTLAAPDHLAGQPPPSQKGGGMWMGTASEATQVEPPMIGPDPPWSEMR